jgi:serine/threonine protein kinase
MTDPVYVSNGASGCVLRPAISCEKKKPMGNDTVSKLFNNDKSAAVEYMLNKNIANTIDHNHSFTIKMLEQCDIQTNLFSEQELKKCKNLSDKTDNSVLKQIVYRYGGYDLRNASKRFGFKEIFLNIQNIFEGLIELQKKQICHMDIKVDNIVYDNETGKANLIDFGVSKVYNEIYFSWSPIWLPHKYKYYPPEFVTAYLYKIKGYAFFNIESLRSFEPLLKQNFSILKETILDEGRKLLNDCPRFLDEWNKLYIINMDRFYKFIIKDLKKSSLNDKLRDFANRIDVFSLGISILELLFLCIKNKTTNVQDDEHFYIMVLRLVSKMIYFTPDKRKTPRMAYNMYKSIIHVSSQLSPMSYAKSSTESPVKPSTKSPLKPSTKSPLKPSTKSPVKPSTKPSKKSYEST